MACPGQTNEFRIFLLAAKPGWIFAHREAPLWRLPRLCIPQRTRPAEQLQQAIQHNFGISSTILEIHAVESQCCRCVVAEVNPGQIADQLTAVPWTQICKEDLAKQDTELLCAILHGKHGPLSKPGWIREAITWIRSEIGGASGRHYGIRQYNAGGGFALLRFTIPDGRIYWMKASGAPNCHEFDVTCLLAKICPAAVPSIIASRRDWNAWLMEDAGKPLEDHARLPVLEAAASALAFLQKTCLTRHRALINAGASAVGLNRLRNDIPVLIEYLSLAMEHQASTKVPRVPSSRLREIGQLLEDACDSLIALSIPDTLVHNDINPSNILYSGSGCVITDWSEAGIGNPFLTFEHLSLLSSSEAENQRLREIYAKWWSDTLTKRQIDQAFLFARLVAIASYLYGRGDWMTSWSRNDPALEGCARSLARHMDCVSHAYEFQRGLRI